MKPLDIAYQLIARPEILHAYFVFSRGKVEVHRGIEFGRPENFDERLSLCQCMC